MSTSVADRLRVRPIADAVSLAGYDTGSTELAPSKSDAKDELDDLRDELFDAHERLFAEARRSVLLVLQGTDCSGKNGTIKHVVIAMNPAGVRTTSFVEPTEDERREHFLDRYRRALPAPGHLGVFDRSHYEDLIEPTVRGDLDDEGFGTRVAEIVAFERDLVDAGTTVVKCLLHISYDEQRDRLLRRLRRDDKRWKFACADVEDRRDWDAEQAAYGRALAATHTTAAPWFVVPGDHKWYRNWLVAHLLLEVFDDLDPQYPQPDLDLDDLRRRLAPPN